MKIFSGLCALAICFLSLRCKPDLGYSEDFTVTIAAPQLLADDQSQTLVRVEFGQVLHRDEEFTLTTSNGRLFGFPLLDTSAGSSILTIRPGSDFAEFILRSSDLPDENVVVSAVWNRYKTQKPIRFTRACPETLFTTLDQSKIQLGDSILLYGLLLRETGQVSRNTQLQLSLTDSAATTQVAELPPLTVAKPEFRYKFPAKVDSGTYRLVVKIANSGCPMLENVEWFSVEK